MSIRISEFPLCRHIKTDGLRCKSPAVATSAFCYHHRNLRRIRPASGRPRQKLTSRSLPPLDSFQAIQSSLGLVLNGLAMGRIGDRPARRMIEVLRTASEALKKHQSFQ